MMYYPTGTRFGVRIWWHSILCPLLYLSNTYRVLCSFAFLYNYYPGYQCDIKIHHRRLLMETSTLYFCTNLEIPCSESNVRIRFRIADSIKVFYCRRSETSLIQDATIVNSSSRVFKILVFPPIAHCTQNDTSCRKPPTWAENPKPESSQA